MNDSNVRKAKFIKFLNFLTPQEHRNMLEWVRKYESAFESSKSSSKNEDRRRSLVMLVTAEAEDLIAQRITPIVRFAAQKLSCSNLNLDKIEAQVTAHNDGNYYKLHNDNGMPPLDKRELTYVYYFNREPKAFSGGELLLYDEKIEGDRSLKADSFQLIEPTNNSIIFFYSRYWHQVLPVNCQNGNFADSRFTINGWIWRD
ncbi:MAG: 2OG-Fe(II) oxygenase [Cyanobacteriota bacterium]|nr:2OG-Fe(II) oxygenase [Cyanobacteriota bacterium]